jgi:hypothetical protein
VRTRLTQARFRDTNTDTLLLDLLIANGLCPPYKGLKRKHSTVEPSTDKDPLNSHRTTAGPNVQKVITSQKASVSRFYADDRTGTNTCTTDDTEFEEAAADDEILRLKVSLLSQHSRPLNSSSVLRPR